MTDFNSIWKQIEAVKCVNFGQLKCEVIVYCTVITTMLILNVLCLLCCIMVEGKNYKHVSCMLWCSFV